MQKGLGWTGRQAEEHKRDGYGARMAKRVGMGIGLGMGAGKQCKPLIERGEHAEPSGAPLRGRGLHGDWPLSRPNVAETDRKPTCQD